MDNQTVRLHDLIRGIGLTTLAVLLSGMLVTVLVLATDIILILFLGILFGVFLSRISQLLTSYTSLSYVWSLAGMTTLLILLVFGFMALFGVQVDKQITKAMNYTDEGVEQLQDWSNRYPTVETILRSTPFLRQMKTSNDKEGEQPSEDHSQERPQKGDSASDEEPNSHGKTSQAALFKQSAVRNTAKQGAATVAGLFKTTFGLLVNSLLIFFVGLFLAIDPRMYRDGCVELFPLDRRKRTREILDQLGDTLWHWLIGRFASMAITGVSSGMLLRVLGIPMAFTLGVITALLTFIPNIGPAVALVLAILFAIPQGGTIVLLVVIGYISLQLLESYVITPLIQQEQVALPPALLISVQALMGVLFGFLGAAVASPLLAVSKVAVEQAYIQDVLEAPDASDGRHD